MLLPSHSIIFKRSWGTREVPEYWRKANVIQVIKKGKKENLGDLQAGYLHLHPWKR